MNENEDVYFEEEVVVEDYGSTLGEEPSFLTKIGQWGAVLFMFLFPILTLPYTISTVEMNKAYFTAVAAGVLLITWLGGSLQEGRVRLPRSWVFYAYTVFLIAWLLASFFSRSVFWSLLGAGGEPGTFLTFLVSGVLLFVIPALLNDARWVYRACIALFAAQVVVAFFFIFRSVFDIKLLSWANNRSFNIFGDWSSTGAYFAVMAAFLLPLFSLVRGRARFAVSIMFIITLILLGITNFTYGIITLGFVALIFLALLLSQRQGKSVTFSVALLLLLAITLMVLMRAPLSEVATKFGAPIEASPNWTTTFNLTEEAFKESLVFGSGPNTFSLLWDKYRPAEVNLTPIWTLRFTAGAALAPTLIAEGGLAGAFALLFLFAIVLATVFRGLSISDVDQGSLMMLRSTGGAVLALSLLWWLSPINGTLVLLTFLMLGLFIAAFHAAGVSEYREVSLFSSTERGFIASLTIILLLIGGVSAIYQESMRYIAQVAFARGVGQFNTGEGLNTAQISLRRATQYDARQDQFWRALAQMEIIRIQRVVNNREEDQKVLQEQFRTALANAIDYGKRAIDLGPQDASNWHTLAQVYDAVIFTPGSYEFAVENYKKAKELSPTNPAILLSEARTNLGYASVLLLQGESNKESRTAAAELQIKAADLLTQATNLKPDFIDAHFLLAQIYQQQGKMDDAIARAQAAYQIRPNDVGVIFQLGVLYFQKEDLDQAKAAFEAAVNVNENYSNALYFLGLIADRKGDRDSALAHFRKVSELNPENAEIKKIIQNVEAGRPALDAEEAPPPESEKPVEKNTTPGRPKAQ